MKSIGRVIKTQNIKALSKYYQGDKNDTRIDLCSGKQWSNTFLKFSRVNKMAKMSSKSHRWVQTKHIDWNKNDL